MQVWGLRRGDTGRVRLDEAGMNRFTGAQHRKRLCEAAGKVFADRGVLVAYAFGSRISGTPRLDSDLDIGYYLIDDPTGTAFPLKDEMILAAALSAELGVEVDLRNLGSAPLELRGRVLEEGVRIFSGDDVLRVGLERTILSTYHDYKEVFEHMHEIRLRRKASAGAAHG